MDRDGNLRWVRVLTINLLVVVVPFVLYFLVYQAGRADYFHGRNMRALDGIAREFGARLGNVQAVLSYKARDLARADPWATGNNGTDAKILLNTGTDRLALDLEPVPRRAGKEDRQRWPTHPDLVEFWLTSPGDRAKIGVRIRELEGSEDPEKDARLQVDGIPLAQLLPRALAKPGFEDLLLVDGSGSVLYSLGESATRFTDIRPLLAQARAKQDGAEAAPSAEAGTAGVAAVGAGGTAALLSSSRVFEGIEVAARRFDLYSVPVSIPWAYGKSEAGERQAGTTTWYLCGLVPTSQTRAEVQSISPTALAFLILFLVVGSLAWPFLKVWYISHREQLDATDFLFLLLSTLFGAGLLTLLLLDVFTYRSVHASFDRTLQAVGARIDRAFLEEVTNAKADLQCLTESFRDRARFASETDGTPLSCPASQLDGVNVSCVSADGSLCRVELGKDVPYPPFELGFWLDGEGKEVGQWNMRHRFLGKLEVPDRAYFQAALRGELWHVAKPERSAADADEPGIFTMRILARDEGELLAIVSMAVPEPKPEKDAVGAEDAGRVAVLATRFRSLWQPALPGSFGMAVIDDGGRVLYHSNPRRSLIENLFAEADSAHLRAATEARREVLLPVSYHGREHRFYVRPLAASPWTLVVFWEQRFAQTANFELLMTCAMGLLLYTVLFLLAAMVLRAFSSPFRFTWLWPSWQLASAYRRSICVLSSLATLYVLCAFTLSSRRLIALAVAVPIFAVTYLFARLREPIRIETRYRRAAYLAMMSTGLVVAWIALPPGTQGYSGSVAGKWRLMLVILTGLLLVWAFSASWGRWLSMHLGERGHDRHADRLDALVSRIGGRVWRDTSQTGATGSFTFTYVALLMLALVVLSVAPAIAIYRDAMPAYWRPYVRFTQLEYARALDARGTALASDVVRIRPYRDGAPIEAGPVFDERLLAPYDFPAGVDQLHDAPGWPQVLETEAGCEPRGCEAPGCIRWRDELWDRVVRESAAAGVAAYLPVYNAASHRLRDLLAPEASDVGWCFSEASIERDSGTTPVRYEQELLTYRRGYSDPEIVVGARQIDISNRPFEDLQALADDARREHVFAGIVLLVLLGVFALLRSLGGRVFGLQLPSFPVPDPGPVNEHWLEGRSLLLRPPSDVVEALRRSPGVTLIDLHDQEGLPFSIPPLLGRSRTLVLLHFEHRLLDRAWTHAKLELLERLSGEAGVANVVIVSAVDILNWLVISLEESSPQSAPSRTSRWRSAPPAAAESAASTSAIGAPPPPLTTDDLARWSAALHHFRRVRFAQPGWVPIAELVSRFPEPGLVRRWKLTGDRKEAVLLRETDWLHELGPVAERVRAMPAFQAGQLTDEQIVQQVGDHAEAIYRELWTYLTFKERQACVHLAKGELLNPRNVDVLRRLMRKGVIHRDPNFRLASRSLLYFALRAEPREQLAAWDAAMGASTWKSLSTPLLVALGLVAGFLFYTNREFFDMATGFFAAALAGLPLLFQVMNIFTRGGSRAAPSGD